MSLRHSENRPPLGQIEGIAKERGNGEKKQKTTASPIKDTFPPGNA